MLRALLTVQCGLCAGVSAQADTLWYSSAGTDWEKQALPLGNGRLGAAVLGGVTQDRINLTEKSLWTGGPGSAEGYSRGLPAKPAAYLEQLELVQQRLLQEGELSPEYVAQKLGHAVSGYGSFQSLGDLLLSFPHQQVTDYQRTLDLATATASVTYQYQGVDYQRDYFVSYPDDAVVIRLTANQPASISVTIETAIPDNRSAHKNVTDNILQVSGTLNDNQLEYALHIQADIQGGALATPLGVNKAHAGNDDNRPAASNAVSAKSQLQIEHADAVTLKISAATNYKNQYPDYRGEAAISRLNKVMAAIKSTPITTLQQRHLDDYQPLFERMALTLDDAHSALPTNQLLQRYQQGKASASAQRYLEALYFQYGRYLLIASSRPGSLPANLQGVWNIHQVAPWNADYHFNINLQMNYWLANVTNLAQTQLPLFDYVDSLVKPGRIAASSLLGADGWTLFLNSNVWGFTGTIAWPTAFWQPEAGAWIARHYYEHYLFTQDHDFLVQRAWPIMREASELWLQTLVNDPDTNTLVVVPSYSPEHGNFVVGAAMSQQIVTDLLRNTLQLAKTLNKKDFTQRLQQALNKLEPGLRIGHWGQLQEWRQDRDDPASQHRHVSQLYALHPGNQISPDTTPALSSAAATTLNARGDGGTGWSKAWKINFWARLQDGNRAHKLLTEQLIHSTLSNLWDNHPPFQIDGNFGATAGMAEMLLQSHNNDIALLPALPDSWPGGQVTGLKARGNITVSIQWQHGELTQARLTMPDTPAVYPPTGQLLKVRFSDTPAISHIAVTNAQSGAVLPVSLDGNVLTFQAKAGQQYLIKRQHGSISSLFYPSTHTAASAITTTKKEIQ